MKHSIWGTTIQEVQELAQILSSKIDDSDSASLYSIQVVREDEGWRMNMIRYIGPYTREHDVVIEGEAVRIKKHAGRGLRRAALRWDNQASSSAG